MKKILFACSLVVLVAAGCSATQSSYVQPTPTATPRPAASPIVTAVPSSTPVATPTLVTNRDPIPQPPATKPATLLIGTNGTLGQYLTASNGMTLYKSSADSANASNCTGVCAALWPPYTVAPTAKVSAESGINGALGTIKRADGTTQVTYRGMPLYFWEHDAKPGDTTGQGIGGFSVVKP